MKILTNGYGKFKSWVTDRLQGFLIFLLIVITTIIVLWPLMVITVHSGEAGVRYSRFFGGTITDYVYPEGIYLIWPFDKIYIYDVRWQTVMHEFGFLTNKGLLVRLKLAIRYMPDYELLGLLQKEVGPDYVNKIIIPQAESILRRHMGQHDPEDIYTNKEGLLSNIVSLALEEIGMKFVRVDDIIIRSVELPPAIVGAIEEKLVYEQRSKAYDFRLSIEKREAERKRIEAEGINSFQTIIKSTLDDRLLKWQGVQATLELAKSNNTKVVVIGAGTNGLPLILNSEK